MKRVLGVIAFILVIILASCEPEGTQFPADVGTVHIISVGLDYRNAYKTASITQESDGILKGAVLDAVEIAYCFEDIYKAKGIPYDMKLMMAYGLSASKDRTLNYPSASNVLKTIEELETDKRDLILFIYSGHGGLEDDGRGFFCMGKENNDEKYSILYMNDVYSALADKNCSSIALVDTCYAGAMLAQDQQQQYINQALQSFVGQEKFANVSVLASCQDYEESYVELEEYNPLSQEHGYFTLALLHILGWNHGLKSGEDIRFADFGQSGLAVKGYLEETPGSFSVEDLYEQILACWEEITESSVGHRSLARYQEPAKSFTHSIFIPIPYADSPITPESETYPGDTVAIVNGKPYTDFQKAIDAVLKDGEPNPITIVKEIRKPSPIRINFDDTTHSPVVINFSPDTFTPKVYSEGRGEIYIHGKTKEEVPVKDGKHPLINPVADVYYDDVKLEKAYTEFGINITLPDPHRKYNI